RMIPAGDENPLLSPIDLAADEQGTIYITDSKRGKIFRCRVDDSQLTEFHTVSLQRPTGIVYSSRFKQLYVTDTLAQQVVVLGLDGQERFRFGRRGQEPGQFNAPTAININRRGEVLVTDALNSRVQVFSADGHFLTQFGRPGDTSGTFAKPKGIAVDSDGNIYVCDALFDAVQIFDRHGRLLLEFGNSGSRPGQFWMPAGIFIDNHDTIYVADTYNRRIQIFRYLKGD
ncbi:MAG: SMP-30/gluconolactonase/LRE family protein, partial [Deltaproteobacteria bacterium]|nr:SMP-30/gluconolactonase/LRE family protein [Deltaproteobacteria bacterium]